MKQPLREWRLTRGGRHLDVSPNRKRERTTGDKVTQLSTSPLRHVTHRRPGFAAPYHGTRVKQRPTRLLVVFAPNRHSYRYRDGVARPHPSPHRGKGVHRETHHR